jgi:hypothetical protein
MKHFINLTGCVINKLHIIHIVKKPNKYCIHLASNSFSGQFLLSFGYITSYKTTLELCKTKDKADYDTITEFINNETQNSSKNTQEK